MNSCESSKAPRNRVIRMTIESRLEAVSLVGSAVRGILKEVVSDEIMLYQLEVAVVEAVNNAIIHAYDQEENHQVDITLTLHPNAVTFTICDTGKTGHFSDNGALRYDPGDIPSLPERGMGIAIMKSIMDEVRYCRQGGKNCLTLNKRL